MYCDYWNLVKPPFDNVPDASMYVDCHESMENVISETLFAIKEGNECLTVIVGEVGLGKTLSLRVIIDSLEPEKYKVALITNPALSFVQLLREIIGQITGKQCEVKNKVDLLEIFNRLLFDTADQGKKIVIVIDEANVLSPSNLDDLRLLTNMQDDERNLFTLLLVGQMEFARTLEHPKRANLFQRIGTYGHLEKLPSPQAVRTYIESRLKIAGTDRKIFDDDAIPVIWEFSEHGVPRLINKICKLCIKAGETNEFQTISGEVAQQIADRFQKLSKTSTQKRKAPVTAEIQPPEEGVKKRETEKTPKATRPSLPPKEAPDFSAPVRPIPQPRMEEPAPPRPRMAVPEEPPPRPVAPPPFTEEPMPVRPRGIAPEQPASRRPMHPSMDEPLPVRPRIPVPEEQFIRPAPPRMEEPVSPRPRMTVPEEPPPRPVAPPMQEPAALRPRMPEPEEQFIRPAPPRMEEPVSPRPRMAVPEEPPPRPVAPPMQEPAALRPRMPEPEEQFNRPAPPRMEEPVSPRPRMAVPEEPPPRPVAPPMQEPAALRPRMPEPEEQFNRPAPPRMEEPVSPRPRMAVPEEPPPRPVAPPMEEPVAVKAQTVPLAKPAPTVVPTPGFSPAKAAASTQSSQDSGRMETKQDVQEQPTFEDNEVYEDVLIGQQTIKLAIPANVIRQAQSSNNENKNKLAGYWSAQILKGNPSLTHSSFADPVSLWFEVKNVILKKFNSPSI